MPESIELSQAQCETLLRAGVVGRLAVSTPGGPHVIPLNYSVVDDAIILRTSPYSLLATYARGSTVAFEVDQFDHEYHQGWSVVARGCATFVTDDSVLDHIRAVWRPHPWASGNRELHVRLAWDELTGRRLGPYDDLVADLVTRRTV